MKRHIGLWMSMTVLAIIVLVTALTWATGTGFKFNEVQTALFTPTHVKNVTASTTLALTDDTINVSALASAITITLPPATTDANGKSYTINKTDASFNAVTVVASVLDTEANTIEGVASRKIQITGTMVLKLNTANDWKIVWETNPINTNMYAGSTQVVGALMVPLTTVSTASTTLTSVDCGKTILVATDALTHTLPSPNGIAGCTFRFINSGANAANIVTIATTSPGVIAGTIFSGGTLPLANIITYSTASTLNNTKSTAKEGDMVEVISSGTTTWLITRGTGTWAVI